MKLLLAAMVLSGAAVRADDAKPVRVGASHRVDVIAPGERVETAIDRMRRSMGPSREIAPRPPADRLAPRGPAERSDRERGASDRAASPEGTRQQNGAMPQQPQQQGNQGPPRR
jgi:hypothetical protein